MTAGRSAFAPAWAILLFTGIAVTVVGWFDLGLLWYPIRFGNVEWEFGTISAHLNGMPLGTVGFGLVAAALVAQHRSTRPLAWVAGLIVASHLAIGAIYLLDVPVALKGSAPQVIPMLKKGMLKAGVYLLVYLAFYTVLAIRLWRRPSRSQETGGGSAIA